MKGQFHKHFCDKRLLSISLPLQHFSENFEITATGKYAKMAIRCRKHIVFYVKEKISLKNRKMVVNIFWFGFQLTQITFVNPLLTLGVDESLLIPLEFGFDERHCFLGNLLLLLLYTRFFY